MLIVCLVVEIIQRWMTPLPTHLWPYIKVKVIETSMSIYICYVEIYRHAKLECHSLTTVWYIAIIAHGKNVSSDAVVTLNEGQGHRTGKDYIVGQSSQQTVWVLHEQFLK